MDNRVKDYLNNKDFYDENGLLNDKGLLELRKKLDEGIKNLEDAIKYQRMIEERNILIFSIMMFLSITTLFYLGIH
jgi:t-SNARE complex subunit (syntaxin)